MLTVETPDNNIVFWSNFTLQAATDAHGNMKLKEDQQTKIYSDKQGSFQLRSTWHMPNIWEHSILTNYKTDIAFH